LRTSADFEYERAIAQVNKAMAPDIESVFLLTAPEHTPINSTIVKDILRHGGDASKFVPFNQSERLYGGLTSTEGPFKANSALIISQIR
jgi:pantetheine-phosphate adenylyltransferase